MHLMGADLDFDRLRARPDHRRMDGAVQIVLWRRDVVVELPGDELPQRVHDAERRIAFGDVAHEHARRANVHELLEGELFGLHLAPDAVNVLRPARRSWRRCRRSSSSARSVRFQVVDIALAFGTAHLERGGDVLVVARLQVAERKILQFPLQLPHAQPVGERRIHLAGLGRELALLGSGSETWRRAFSAVARRAARPPAAHRR